MSSSSSIRHSNPRKRAAEDITHPVSDEEAEEEEKVGWSLLSLFSRPRRKRPRIMEPPAAPVPPQERPSHRNHAAVPSAATTATTTSLVSRRAPAMPSAAAAHPDDVLPMPPLPERRPPKATTQASASIKTREDGAQRRVVPEDTSKTSLGLRRRSQSAEPETAAYRDNNQDDESSSIAETLQAFRPNKHSTDNHTNNTDKLAIIDRHFHYVALLGIACWIVLVTLCYMWTPPQNLEKLDGMEKTAPLMAFALVLLSVLSKLFPLFYRDIRSVNSGLLVLSTTVQVVALLTDAMMAFLPTPVVMDPVLGTRVHLLRWCEWTPLAFAMTFMTESIGMPTAPLGGLKMIYVSALCQGLSTFCGLLFPFANGIVTWSILMVISCVLFLFIFVRLWHSREVYKNAKKGASVDEREVYDRIRLSYKLLYSCAAVWSILVVGYFLVGLGRNLEFLKGTVFSHPACTMVFESTFDVVSKSLFTSIIIDVHRLIFDDTARAERRLEEIRRMMSVLWESSSDIIAISVRGISGTVTTMVSPTIFRLNEKNERVEAVEEQDNSDAANSFSLSKALVFDLDGKEFDNKKRRNSTGGGNAMLLLNPAKKKPSRKIKPGMVRFMFSGLPSFPPSGGGHNEGSSSGGDSHNYSPNDEELSSMADLVVRAWHVDREDTLMHDIVIADGLDLRSVRCEAKVNYLDDNARIIVVRDISERFKLFEAEKRVISETTARLKDAEANRFTRHEVKNGLLAAIHLCESLRECIGQDQASQADSPGLSQKPSAGSINRADAARHVSELDKTLSEVLDTVLSEAMARDVIHEIYQPKMERVNVQCLLSELLGRDVRSERFPVVADPPSLPLLMFDPQLLKFIHNNAVSNGCKYGEKGGIVTTRVRFDERTKKLEMQVANLPGEHHDELIKLGNEAREAVFTPGKRLHRNFQHYKTDCNNDSPVSHSSGDGGFIMKKCAKTLGGDCDIVFKKDCTVFTFSCPATTFDEAMKYTRNSIEPSTFQIPRGTWAISIDDSKIQRKLLKRLDLILGVEESRCIVLGETSAEITGFDDFVIQHINAHPNDYFLLIVDENLDFVEDGTLQRTISGSACIENIRQHLRPDQERRLLALVRSANDSSDDVALYNARAHGFIPKAPIQKERILETLAPLWAKRHMTTGGTLPKNLSDSALSENDVTSEIKEDCFRIIDNIDEFCSSDDATLVAEKWPIIWESNLHVLKGNLLTFSDGPLALRIVNDINMFRGPHIPIDFFSRWGKLRALIVALFSTDA